jgi:tetratricopeptide (TPR) repeat protein
MALSEIEKLERRYAENPQGLTFAPLAEVHRKNGDVARALELLRPGLSLHPDYIPASIVLGRCHLDLGELPAAETAFTHVLELDGENVIALKALADITERQGRFDESERWLRTLLAIDRSNDDARDQLTRVESTRRQTGTSAIVMPAEAPAEASAATGTPAEAASDGPTADALAEAATPSPDSPPRVSDPSEQVMGWVAESGSTEAAEATPLDLEELDPSLVTDAAQPEGIQLEQPVTLEESVQPLAGLVGRGEDLDVGSFDHVTDFRVETAEDIVLNSSGGSEFQVANAADELLARETFEPPPSPPEPMPDLEPAAEERFAAATDAWARSYEEAAPSPPDVGTSEAEASAAAAQAAGAQDSWREPVAPTPVEPPPPDAVTAEVPAAERDGADEPSEEPASREAEPAVRQSEFEVREPEHAATDWTPPWARPADEEPAAPAVAESGPPPSIEPREPAEPDLVVTASMAELLLQQGHPVEALTVYRLLANRGDESRYRDKIAELERLTAPPQPPAPAPPPVPAAAGTSAAPAPAYSILVTHGQSAEAFLRGVLAARPPAAAGGPPAHAAAASRSSTADPGGAPTRPAHDSLSLSSVFGEESGPTQPAVPTAGAGAGGGVSYDEFFSGPSSTPAPRPARAPDPKNDDLDQFHAWLQNLKR